MIALLSALVTLLLSAGGILIALIVGLTQLVKQAFPGIKDQYAVGANVLIGLAVGTLISLGQVNGLPADITGWVVLVICDLLCSLIAAGIYKVATAPTS